MKALGSQRCLQEAPKIAPRGPPPSSHTEFTPCLNYASSLATSCLNSLGTSYYNPETFVEDPRRRSPTFAVAVKIWLDPCH